MHATLLFSSNPKLPGGMAPELQFPERLSRSEILDRQETRLRQMLAEIVPANPFWGRRFSAAGIEAGDIRSLADLARLPFTTKAELVADQREQPPYGTNLTYPLTACLRLHQTSGTTGSPLRWLDTPASWDWILGCWQQIYRMAGVRPDDRLCFPFSFGPFLGFWAAFDGAQRLGNLCLAAGGMSSQARLQLIFDNAVTVVCCTPTYALRLAEAAAESGLDLAAGPVRSLIVAGEPGGCLPAMRRGIETAWGARVFDHWGMTEIGPLASECVEDPGNLCVLETECIAEIIDPVSLQPVPAGTSGELVLTNLGRWGSPLLRYRTGDVVQAATGAATGGYQLLRLEGGIRGRCDDMLTIRGNNFYPSALEELIRQFSAVAEYRIEVRTRKAMHEVRIEVEPTPEADRLAQSAELAAQIAHLVKDRLNFHAEVRAVACGSLPRFEMKGRRTVRVIED